MRQILSKYLLTFKRMYPTHPAPETWEVYERALSDVGDVDLVGACEICVRELTYFPMPAEIRKRVKPADTFLSTAVKYEDHPLTPEAKADFDAQMQKVAGKLGLRKMAKEKAL